jgi:hypothetical protein
MTLSSGANFEANTEPVTNVDVTTMFDPNPNK